MESTLGFESALGSDLKALWPGVTDVENGLVTGDKGKDGLGDGR